MNYEIIYVYETNEDNKQWIFVRRLDDYEIIVLIKDGCSNYTIMDLTKREKLLLSILDDKLNTKHRTYIDIINTLTAKIVEWLNNKG